MRPVAVVTGGNTGIGASISEELSKAGFLPAILYGEDGVSAEKLAGQLEGAAFPVNLMSEESIEKATDDIRSSFGPVSVLVNNAGIQQRKPFLELTVEDFDRMLSINLRGTFLMTRALLQDMVSARSGKIINIASQTALLGRSEMVHYTASKGGIVSMTKSLAREFAPFGIRVNCVAPGPVSSGPSLSNKEERDEYMNSIPLQRFANPKEVAETVRFLAEGANYYTGQVFSPNGGEVM